MYSLSGVALVLAVLSAAICCSTADHLSEGAVQDHDVHVDAGGDTDGQDHDVHVDVGGVTDGQDHDVHVDVGGNTGGGQDHDDHAGEADFNTRLLEALKQNSHVVEEQIAECRNMHQDCKKLIDEDRVVSNMAIIAFQEIACLDHSFPLIVRYTQTGSPTKTEALDSFFTDTCNKVEAVAKCVKKANEGLRSCVCDVEIDVFSIIPSAVTDVLRKECAKDKTKFDKIKNNGGLVFWKQHVNQVEKCIYDAFAWPSPLWAEVRKFESDSLAQLLIHRYKGVEAFRRCLGGIEGGKDTTLKYMDSLTNLALQDMHCVKDKSNTLAPCTKVVGGSEGIRPGLHHSLGLAVVWLVLALLNNTPILS